METNDCEAAVWWRFCLAGALHRSLGAFLRHLGVGDIRQLGLLHGLAGQRASLQRLGRPAALGAAPSRSRPGPPQLRGREAWWCSDSSACFRCFWLWVDPPHRHLTTYWEYAHFRMRIMYSTKKQHFRIRTVWLACIPGFSTLDAVEWGQYHALIYLLLCLNRFYRDDPAFNLKNLINLIIPISCVIAVLANWEGRKCKNGV